MDQSQLIELIWTLNPDEKEQILQFSTLTMFNSGRMRAQVIPLLNYCLTLSEPFERQSLDKKEIFSIVFPDQSFVEGKLEKVMVDAHKIVRSFLLTQRYFSQDNEFHQLLDFAEIARKRKLGVRFQQSIAKLQKIQEGVVCKDDGYFYRQYLLEYAISDEESVRNQAKGDLNLPQTLYAFEQSCLLRRLELLNQFLLQQKIAKIDVTEAVQALINDCNVPENYLKEAPALKIHQQIFSLLKQRQLEPTDVQALFDLILFHESELTSKNLVEFYAYLRSLCILALTVDFERTELEDVLHKLYKDNLERGYLHYEGKINRSKYWAVSSNATRTKDFDWAISFIEKYRYEIRDENETQDIYRLNLANYLFAVGRYSECLDNIPDTSPFADYLLLGKRLELKALYELQSDLLPYKLDAFKMFISRTSQKLLSDSQRQINSDFANLLHQLVNSKPADPKRSELLVSRLQEKKQSAEWRWLLEKAKALKST
jgi:hypothetical protein